MREKILLGAKNILHNVKCIEVEIILTNYYNNISSFNTIESILKKYDFILYNISSPVYDNNKNIQWLNAIYYKSK